MNSMIPKNIKVYVISLPEDQCRRNDMRKRFGCMYDDFEIIDGVRLSERKELADIYGRQSFDLKLTLAELGCALSHVSALERFIRSKASCALILEDDAIGAAADIIEIANVMESLPNDAFLLCGGQDGLRGEPYNYGKQCGIKDVFQIPGIAKKFYTRACCYCVTVQSAAHLLGIQKRELGLSDNWGDYFKEWESFFFTKKIMHPICLFDSNIEFDRLASVPKSELARIRKDGISRVLKRFFSKLLIRRFSSLLGLVKIN